MSPGKIYKKCLAKARDERRADDVIRSANSNADCIKYLYTTDVLRAFYGQDYGLKKAQKYIDEWVYLDLCFRRIYKGYEIIGFDASVVL